MKMEESLREFQLFAEKVRSTSGFLSSKFKAIQISTDEAKRCRNFLETSNTVDDNGERIKLPLRPETPGNIRGLYKSVKRDITGLRETFTQLHSEHLNPVDLEQIDCVIQELEKQLYSITVELEKLKNLRPRTSRPNKSKSARKSGKNPDANHGMEIIDKSIAINPIENNDNGISSDSKRPVALSSPFNSTKLISPCQNRTKVTVSERKSKIALESSPYPKKRVWGSFHGHKTLSRDNTDIPFLPSAPDTASLVSCGSRDSDKSPRDVNNLSNKSHFALTHYSKGGDTTKFKRDNTHIKPTSRYGNTFSEARKENSLLFPNKRRYTSQSPNDKSRREFSKMETVDLNVQVNGTIRSSPPHRMYSPVKEGEFPGEYRKPTYLVNRSKTIPETHLGKKLTKNKSRIGFGSSFTELPPLSSLKRSNYQTSPQHPN